MYGECDILAIITEYKVLVELKSGFSCKFGNASLDITVYVMLRLFKIFHYSKTVREYVKEMGTIHKVLCTGFKYSCGTYIFQRKKKYRANPFLSSTPYNQPLMLN